MRLFDKHRPRDVNIETGIGATAGTVPFYMFDEPALNSFDEELSRSRDGVRWNITQVVDVPVAPLRDILEGHLPGNTGPSFLSVDVEGRDLDVLQSNDWSAFRPTYVLAECLGTTIEEALHGSASALMSSVGYGSIAKTANTSSMRSRRSR